MNKLVFILGVIVALISIIFSFAYALLMSYATGVAYNTMAMYQHIATVFIFVGLIVIIAGILMRLPNTPSFRMVLRVTKSEFVLMIALVNATATYIGTVVQLYMHNQTLSIATSVFIGVIANAIVTYLSTQEQTAPTS